MLHCICPLLAQSGHHAAEFQCLLLGVKRTLLGRAPMSSFDPKRTFLLRAIRKRSLSVIGSRGYLLPALRTATPPSCAVGGPTPQRHRRVRGRTRTKSGSRMALQVPGCDADVSLQPVGIPYQFQCAAIAPRRWLGVHLALSPTKLLSSGSE